MVKFIFEDNYESPVSVLLGSSYNGSSYYFSCGTDRLLSKIVEIYNNDDYFIVFFDLVPNNKSTLSI